MQSAADQFWVISSTTDPSGRCTYLDERWRSFTGQEPAEALRYGWLGVLHPDDSVRASEALCSALDERAPFRLEFRVRRSDGAYGWALAVGAPRFDESGAFLGYVGSIVDIDDRRTTEAAVAASEERQAFLLKLSDALRPLADPLDIQRQAARILGLRLQAAHVHYGEVSEDGVWAVVREDYCDGVSSVVGKRRLDTYDPLVVVEFRGGRTLVIDDAANDARLTSAEREAPAALQNGAYAIAPLFKAGRPAAILVVHHLAPHRWTINEISLIEATAERTWEAVERANAEEALRRARESLELAVDAGQMGIWDLDVARDYSGPRNLRHDQFFGYETRQEAWGTEIARRHVLEEDKPAFDAAFARAMETGKLDLEVRVRRPNGEIHWMAARGRVSFDELGRPVRAAGVNFDVTELKRSEQALIEADRRKDEFLAILGHELRNPLAPIQHVAQLLGRPGGVDVLKSDRAPIDMMKRQVGHLVRLVDDLLDISRINSGKIELRKERAKVASVVADALGMSQTHIEAKGHQVGNRVAADPLVVYGDPVRLTQVVTNLVKNAAKYTPPGGLIEIRTVREGEEAVVRVRDNGVGIALDMLPFVFDLFSQVDSREQNREGGLGVGLALAWKLVDLHGGRIEAHSAGLGKGSEFVVRLPLDVSVASKATAEAGEPRSGAALRILVIDDNVDVADSLAMLMESLGAEVQVAYDGASGVEAAAEFRPDMAFVDIRMPGIDGHETARRMRARLGKSAPTLIALTGLGQDEDRKLSQQAGFDKHLTKPVSAEALEALFRRDARPNLPAG